MSPSPPGPERGYVELQVTSCYSFLRSGSRIEDYAAQAAAYGYTAMAITDRNSLAGIVRAHQRFREAGAQNGTSLRLIVGCRLDLTDFASILVYPTDLDAYSRLCRLLSRGKSRGGKGRCTLGIDDLAAHREGLLGILLPPDDHPATLSAEFLARLDRFAGLFGTDGQLSLSLRRRPDDIRRLARLSEAATAAGIGTVATGDVLYHAPERRILFDVVTCIREGCTIDAAGFRREASVDRHLRPPAEMQRLMRHFPESCATTTAIAERCTFSVTELHYNYPDELEGNGLTAQQTLARHIADKLSWRYPGGATDKIHTQLAHELDLIGRLDYAPYFLTVHSIVNAARKMGILCQGRGSAANSLVCYVLGITSVDPIDNELLFERFISADRREPPDIDVDFEHERREEVIQWIYKHYGRDRAALCATVVEYGARGALREVGKVMGLSEDVTAALARQIWGGEGVLTTEDAEKLGLNPDDRRLRLTLELAGQLMGFPRHLSQHPGGFVLTRDRLDHLVPIEPATMADRQVIEWDKDDIDELGFMKVDVLGLGMLGCLRRAFNLLKQHRDMDWDLCDIPADDPDTYEMIRRADTIGTFQIESRAQMSMLPRLKPRKLYDLVIQVAIVRPGPIQGDMVHPYLRRREGLEVPDYPDERLRGVLGKTLGVPLFQEQAMRVAVVCAGFTPNEADQLRRSMATFKRTGGVNAFETKLIDGMMRRGYSETFARRLFDQIKGFGSYGFPESHAASFAILAYASSWMKCRHPDIFCAALLNAQPMGFYAPAQIVRDARDHGVPIRPVCINASDWDCTLEPDDGDRLAVRLGLRMARGLSQAHAARLVEQRHTPYPDIPALWRRASIPIAALQSLAEADAFRSLGLDRRAALWRIDGLGGAAETTSLPLFAAIETPEPAVSLTPMCQGSEVVEDYRSTGLSLRRHPVSFLRAELDHRRVLPCARLTETRDGARVSVAGIVLMRQRPGSAKGVLFMTLEDETGIANLVIWPDRFERQRPLILSARMILCHGRLQREGHVIHVVSDRLEDGSALLRSVGAHDDLAIRHGRGDGATHPATRDPRDSIRVPTRDFR